MILLSCGGGGTDIPEVSSSCEAQEFTLQQAQDSIMRGIKQGYYNESIDDFEVAKSYVYEYDVLHSEMKLDFEKEDYGTMIYTLVPEDLDKGTWRMAYTCDLYIASNDIQALEKSAITGVPVTSNSDYLYSYKEAKEIRDNYLPASESWDYLFYSKLAQTCSETELYRIHANDDNNYNIRIEINRLINDKYAVITWMD